MDRMEARPRRSFVVRAIWAACLLLAAGNHAYILLKHGLTWDYGVGGASALYWTSLTFIDPTIAALLFARPRWGVAATLLLMLSNVTHNLWVLDRYIPDGEVWSRLAASPIHLSQIGFLLFALLTAPIALRSLRSGAPSPGSGPCRSRALGRPRSRSGRAR
jgi:hypothetical protein